MTKLQGLFPAMLTPFDQQGNLALQYVGDLLEFARNANVDGVVVCGTNGEGTSMTVAERKLMVEKVMAQKGNFTVIVGTGANNLADTLELTRHASQVGADATLALPPFFIKNPTTEGLANWFRPVLDIAHLPCFLYNIPQFSAVTITDALLERLEDHPSLAGVKDSTGDWNSTSSFINNYRDLKIFGGSDYLAAKCYLHGAAGCISGGSDPFPELAVAVRDAYRSGKDIDKAQTRLSQMLDILKRYPFAGASKSVLAHRSLPRLYVRPPLTNLNPNQEKEMISEFRAIGLL